VGGHAHSSHFDAPVSGVLSANELGLDVSATDGSINLANSVRQGLFGSNPHNGDTKEIPIYYRLGDASRHSLMKSTVIVHYYNTLADVPVALLASCQASQQAFTGHGAVLSTETDAVETDGGPISRPITTPTVTGTTPTTGVKAAAVAAPVAPRPPQVVLVVKGH
jgi:subtilase family serine protease